MADTPCSLKGWKPREFTPVEAKQIGNAAGVDWERVDLEQFRKGLSVELEHGGVCSQTNVTGDDLNLTAQIALVHLYELPDYYDRLEKMEEGCGCGKMEMPKEKGIMKKGVELAKVAAPYVPLIIAAIPK